MKKITAFAGVALAAMVVGVTFLPAPAQAITYGQPDCENNSSNLNCGNRNVVSVVGITPDFRVSVRCSGSLLHKSDSRILILTAGHCVQAWARGLQEGWLQTVGVSFDADVRWSWFGQYVLGGKPLLNRHYGPSLRSFNIYHDYAVVAFPATQGQPMTAMNAAVDLSDVDTVTLPSVDFVLSLLDPANPPLFTNVGYGISEWLNAPGDGGNAGGIELNRWYGLRYVSEATAPLNTMMQDQSMLVGSSNPARGYNGTCNGDSGGPNFFVDSAGHKIQIGVTSSGDKRCRATSIISRLDIPQAQEFIDCAVDATTAEEYAACGCTTLNNVGVCD